VSKKDGFEELFNRADNAMYIAKKKGKNRYCVYG
jgi:PleD family two-component response regulator